MTPVRVASNCSVVHLHASHGLTLPGGHSGVRHSCRSLRSDTRSLAPQDEQVRASPYQTIDLWVTLKAFLSEYGHDRVDASDDGGVGQPPLLLPASHM
jgi:hypothetical protein